MNTGHSIPDSIQPPHAGEVFPGQSGFTLIELMLSLAIGATVVAATLNIFTVTKSHAEKHFTTIRQQQDMRVGLEVFEQEVRLATAESIQTADPDRILFQANLSALRTNTTGALLPGQFVIIVQDGSGWGAGKTIVICSATNCESHRLARTGQRNQLTLVEPLESSFSAGAAVEVRNRVLYYAKRDENETVQLMRMVDGGASVLIGRLQNVRFSYWDEMGRRTDTMPNVKRVGLEIQSNQPQGTMRRDVPLQS
ncbi:MAG: prepilin-type N-terminal cleavage/methylation domain-containing protein [Nitrospira sp.]|nr:prepilin-type N-terminal cleavage/methylation domain-containing protein [Nitrospira sp.]MDH4302824.1 prepilin-type N-terminal cleavage/methylation domain-containing protein [Nitrospira sp.]MDH5192300.1 prepilin-type N-terminal cleavage/methylation domain-containing protein [Nitrospira sp.]